MRVDVFASFLNCVRAAVDFSPLNAILAVDYLDPLCEVEEVLHLFIMHKYFLCMVVEFFPILSVSIKMTTRFFFPLNYYCG